MRLIRFVVPDRGFDPAALQKAGEVLLDLAEYVHPDQRSAARESLVAAAQATRGKITVRLPANPIVADLEAVSRVGVARVVLSNVSTPEQVQAVASALGGSDSHTRLILEVRSGSVLRKAEALATAHPAVSALWLGLMDLAVDLQDKPAGMYFYDAPEPRMAAPDWTRSFLLTVARAAGLELWGQLDLTFADPLPPDILRETVDRAEASGFDALITRHASAVSDLLERRKIR